MLEIKIQELKRRIEGILAQNATLETKLVDETKALMAQAQDTSLPQSDRQKARLGYIKNRELLARLSGETDACKDFITELKKLV